MEDLTPYRALSEISICNKKHINPGVSIEDMKVSFENI